MFKHNTETGYAWVKKDLTEKSGNFMPDMETFAGNFVKVLERNPEGDCLCITIDDKVAMADIRAEAINLFIPIVKEGFGDMQYLYPTKLGIFEKMNWSTLAFENGNDYNAVFIYFATKNHRCPTNSDFREIAKLCENINNYPEILAIKILMKKFKENPSNFKRSFN